MRRTLWIGAAAVAVVIAVLVGLANWTLDPASLKPRLIEAAERATGRTLTLSGPIGLRLSLMPTITMQDVALSNPPGFSRPDMVKVERVELGLALMPLLRHRFEVDHVTLVRPDILLETDQAGHSNWAFRRAAAKPPAAESDDLPTTDGTTRPAPDRNPPDAPPPSPAAAQRQFTPVLRNLTMVDGRVGWTDPSGHPYVAGLDRLSLTEPGGPLADIDGTITYEGRVIRLTARTGALEDLGSAFAAAPWPVSVKLVSDRTTITADGKIDHPLRGRGYAFSVNADVPDPSSLESLLPRLPLSTLGEIGAHAEIADSGGPVPTISALRVTVASANIETLVRGARLEDIAVNADSGTPLHVAARMTLDGFDSAINGTVGDLPWLIGGRSAPVAVDLTWTEASARATVQGTIQAPRRLSGYDLNVAVDMPEPALVLKDAPPGLTSVMLRTRLTDTPEPMPFALTSSAGDLEGALSVTYQPRWSVRGQIVSRHLDLDLLRGAARPEASPAVSPPTGAAAPEAPGMSVPPVTGPRASPTPPVESGGTHAPAGGSVVASEQGPLIPDTRLPFPLLRAVDGDVGFTFTHVLLNGADVRHISGTVSAKDGRLRVDPFNIAAPDQRMTGVLEVDAASTPPSVHMSAEAPGLALRPLLAALGLPEVATGFAAVRADLTGEGDTPRAIAGSLNGWAEVAVEGGQLDARTMNAWLGPLQPLHMQGPDVTDLRCFAMRADAKSGVLAIDPMALNTPVLIVEGGGDVDLRTETMSLRLRPRGKIGATGIAVPVRLTGPWRDPSAKVDISSKGFGGGALAGLLLGGKDIMGAAGGGDPCPAALARAREAGPSEAQPAGKP